MCFKQKFVRLKDELTEIILIIKQMILHPLMMILYCLWIVVTFQEQKWIKKQKQLAEEDQNNVNNEMPNEFIQGFAIAVCRQLICRLKKKSN